MKTKSSWVFYLGRFIFQVLFKLLWGWEIRGQENVPLTGGVIIAPNHRTNADPPMIGGAMKRPLHFMAKEELFKVPVLGFLISQTNAFPVSRGTGDVGAFKAALKLLENGESLLMFPEGTRAKDVDFRPAKQGVGMVACWAQVPVVPVRIFHPVKLSSFGKLRIKFGKPMMPPKDSKKENYRIFSDAVMEEIKKITW